MYCCWAEDLLLFFWRHNVFPGPHNHMRGTRLEHKCRWILLLLLLLLLIPLLFSFFFPSSPSPSPTSTTTTPTNQNSSSSRPEFYKHYDYHGLPKHYNWLHYYNRRSNNHGNSNGPTTGAEYHSDKCRCRRPGLPPRRKDRRLAWSAGVGVFDHIGTSRMSVNEINRGV